MLRVSNMGSNAARTLLRYLSVGLALGGICAVVLNGAPASGQANFLRDGTAGFVVANIDYALSQDADQTGACPQGMTEGYPNILDAWINPPTFDRPASERTEADYAPHFRRLVSDPQNYCQHPELAQPDHRFRTVSGRDIPAYGIDLDGQVSRANGRPAPGTCAHADFRGFQGERGIDNQFFRVAGCTTSFQSTGQSNGLIQEQMLVGQWGILLTLSGVEDVRNDDSVQLNFYALAEPITLSPSREPLPFSTYAYDHNPRFQATARGHINNGVLTTEPVDVRFYSVFDAELRMERPLRDARIQATLSQDGVLEGYLAGYTPVEDMYDLQYGFRDGLENGTDHLAPLQMRNSKSVGQAFTIGHHTCEGAYQALQAQADGHADPATGRCTSISTQYRIRAIPAFVIDAATRTDVANER